MAKYFDRYNNFRFNNEIKPIPGLTLKKQDTDKTVIFKLGDTRLDKLSNTYYNSPYYGWLILLANPEYGGLEFLIPDQSVITIPFPLDGAISRYTALINDYNILYGIK